jgi:hypothetical protein
MNVLSEDGQVELFHDQGKISSVSLGLHESFSSPSIHSLTDEDEFVLRSMKWGS